MRAARCRCPGSRRYNAPSSNRHNDVFPAMANLNPRQRAAVRYLDGPLLVLAGWCSVRDSAAPTAAFILINSIAGLAGLLTRHPVLPDPLPYWVLAVVAGGLIGASFGARRLDNRTMRRALAAVLLIAGAKMVV